MTTQADLVRFLELQPMVKEFKKLGDRLKKQAISNIPVQEGNLIPTLTEKPGRKNVSWKAIVERLKGSGYIKQVTSATKRTPTISFSVEER